MRSEATRHRLDSDMWWSVRQRKHSYSNINTSIINRGRAKSIINNGNEVQIANKRTRNFSTGPAIRGAKVKQGDPFHGRRKGHVQAQCTHDSEEDAKREPQQPSHSWMHPHRDRSHSGTCTRRHFWMSSTTQQSGTTCRGSHWFQGSRSAHTTGKMNESSICTNVEKYL